MTRTAHGHLKSVLKEFPNTNKSKISSTKNCILPVMIYGLETMRITVKTANILRTAQRPWIFVFQWLEMSLSMYTKKK